MLQKIQETAEFLKAKMTTHPETAIILGTGLGSLVNEITDKYEIKYEDIPNFPLSTVEGHSGKLIFGKLGNKEIMAMQGRFHYYEGYSMKEVTFPVRVMRELGIKTLFVSNAAGGMNPDFLIGDRYEQDLQPRAHCNGKGDCSREGHPCCRGCVSWHTGPHIRNSRRVCDVPPYGW